MPVESRGKLRINFLSRFVDLVCASAGAGSASFEDPPFTISIVNLLSPAGRRRSFLELLLSSPVGMRSKNKVAPRSIVDARGNLHQPLYSRRIGPGGLALERRNAPDRKVDRRVAHSNISPTEKVRPQKRPELIRVHRGPSEQPAGNCYEPLSHRWIVRAPAKRS